uniref:Exportin-1 C-terminal domain-containing protein n=1 Tax=Panagrolaimus sp. JU765 TaxID=591449 RepID=A0AC34R0F6_9BILA
MAVFNQIWDKLCKLVEDDIESSTLTTSIEQVLRPLSLQQVLTMSRFEGNILLSTELFRHIFQRFSRVDEPIASNVFPDFMQHVFSHPNDTVFRSACHFVAMVAATHSNEIIFAENGGLKPEFLATIQPYFTGTNLRKILRFLNELLLDITDGVSHRCSFSSAAKTEVLTKSRDFLLPEIYEVFHRTAPTIGNMRPPLDSTLLSDYIELYRNFIKFDRLSGIRDYQLPRCLENNVRLAVDVLYGYYFKVQTDGLLAWQAYLAMKSLAGHRIFQVNDYPLSPANIELFNYHLSRFPEIIEPLRVQSPGLILNLLNKFMPMLPSGIDLNFVTNLVLHVSEIMFTEGFNMYNEDLDCMKSMRGSFNVLRARFGDVGLPNRFNEFYLRMCSQIEDVVCPAPNYFYDSEACKGVCETISTSIMNFPPIVEYFVGKINGYADAGNFSQIENKICWNLCLFAAALDFTRKLVRGPVYLLLGEDFPDIDSTLANLLNDDPTNILSKICRAVFHMIESLMDHRLDNPQIVTPPIIASTILLLHRVFNIIENCRNYAGRLNITETTRAFFDFGFRHVVVLSFQFNLADGIQNRLLELTNYGARVNLARGSENAFEEIIQNCLNSLDTPPEITAEFIRCYINCGQVDGNRINAMLTPLSNALNAVLTGQVDSVAAKKVIGLLIAVAEATKTTLYGRQLTTVLLPILKQVIMMSQEDVIMYNSSVELFSKLMVPFFEHVRGNPADGPNQLTIFLDVFDTAMTVGNRFWELADGGAGDYTSLISIMEGTINIMDRQILNANVGEFADWFEVIVDRFVITILGRLTEPRMLSLEFARVAFSFLQSVSQYGNVMTHLDYLYAEIFRKLLIFGMDGGRDFECAETVYATIELLAPKLVLAWEGFFIYLIDPVFKTILFATSNDTARVEAAANILYYLRQKNTNAYLDYFTSALVTDDGAYFESLESFMEPLHGETERSRRRDHFVRLLAFKEENKPAMIKKDK